MSEYHNNRSNQLDDPYERGFADKLYEDYPYEPQDIVVSEEPEYKPYCAPKRKKKHIFLKLMIGFFGSVLLLLIAFIGFLAFYSDCPNESQGHKSNVSTILIAGTDESGLRTDTLMLLCADRENGKINLMSIPRDTKVNSTYEPHKINLAYHANGTGEEGMYWLMDYVRQCVGFVPDGYVLIDLDCIIELVELFGGIDFDVPCAMKHSEPEDDLYIDLQPGLQRLNGKEAMWLVRFRSGYAMADLERVRVQRDFVVAAMDQWLTVKNIKKIPQVLDILEEYCDTNLSTRNFVWFAWSVLFCGTSDMKMTTVPYYLSGQYVCIDADEDYLDLLNSYFNPYKEPIGFDDLNIAY
ncbi:MAG: LytR family transcriptional regulator [Ruminococcaceae bacterium]|nr:LytR family transcriptional regulator [Oscillospiraceae bacterium]